MVSEFYDRSRADTVRKEVAEKHIKDLEADIEIFNREVPQYVTHSKALLEAIIQDDLERETRDVESGHPYPSDFLSKLAYPERVFKTDTDMSSNQEIFEAKNRTLYKEMHRLYVAPYSPEPKGDDTLMHWDFIAEINEGPAKDSLALFNQVYSKVEELNRLKTPIEIPNF